MEKILTILEKYNQKHLIEHYRNLNEQEKEEFACNLKRIDFSYLDLLNNKEEKQQLHLEPIDVVSTIDIEKNKDEYEKVGIKALKEHQIGALLLAGGMGTRLGCNGPKGMFNIGVNKDVYIFEILINNMLDVVKQTGCYIPLFVMTNVDSNLDIINFFEEHDYFGYDKNFVCFFEQEMAPCVSFDGKILLKNETEIVVSPNGNGGWFKSFLKNEKAKQMLESFNLRYINVFSVDNVLQRISDPVFVGAIVSNNAEIGSKVIKKVSDEEKVGVICLKNGKPAVVEYIDLDAETVSKRNEKGERMFNYGVTLNYLFRLDYLYDTMENKLPVHIVKKQINHYDGENYVTDENLKFEFLCVDMIEFANKVIATEVVREKEFAPVKNKEGNDSVATARELLIKNGYEI